jgi:hypothetical protein
MRAIIHGGMYRTGTTSLQAALTRHRPLLRRSGILYPGTPASASFPDTQHSYLFSKALGRDMAACEAYLAEICETARAAQCDTVLLSSELGSSFPEMADSFAEFLAALRRYFDPIRFHFVLREPISYATSLYRELASYGYCSVAKDFAVDRIVELLLNPSKLVAFYLQKVPGEVSFWSYQELAQRDIVRSLVLAMTNVDLPSGKALQLNTSASRIEDASTLLLAPLRALLGQALGDHAFGARTNAELAKYVDFAKLGQAMRADAADELKALYLRVTSENVRAVYAENRSRILRPIESLPEGLRRLLTPQDGDAIHS